MVVINFTPFISKLPHLIKKCFGYETGGNIGQFLKWSIGPLNPHHFQHQLHVSANGVFVSPLLYFFFSKPSQAFSRAYKQTHMLSF